MYNEPLGLPKGTVRAIIALLFSSAFIASVLMGITSTELASIASLIIGHYFAKRQADK